MNLIRRQTNAKSHGIAIGQESIKTHHCESTVVVLLVGWLNICFYQYGPPYIMDAGTYGDAETGPHRFLLDKLALFQSWMGGLGEYTHHIGLPPPIFFIRTPLINITLTSSNQKAFRFSTSGHVVQEKIKVPKYLARKRQMAPELARSIELRH